LDLKLQNVETSFFIIEDIKKHYKKSLNHFSD